MHLQLIRDVLGVGVPASGEADTGGEDGRLPRTHMLDPGHGLVGGARLHAYALWGRQSLWDALKVSSYKFS